MANIDDNALKVFVGGLPQDLTTGGWCFLTEIRFFLERRDLSFLLVVSVEEHEV